MYKYIKENIYVSKIFNSKEEIIKYLPEHRHSDAMHLFKILSQISVMLDDNFERNEHNININIINDLNGLLEAFEVSDRYNILFIIILFLNGDAELMARGVFSDVKKHLNVEWGMIFADVKNTYTFFTSAPVIYGNNVFKYCVYRLSISGIVSNALYPIPEDILYGYIDGLNFDTKNRILYYLMLSEHYDIITPYKQYLKNNIHVFNNHKYLDDEYLIFYENIKSITLRNLKINYILD